MQINCLDLRQDLSAQNLTHKGLKYTSSILYLYHETGLFQLVGLFRYIQVLQLQLLKEQKL